MRPLFRQDKSPGHCSQGSSLSLVWIFYVHRRERHPFGYRTLPQRSSYAAFLERLTLSLPYLWLLSKRPETLQPANSVPLDLSVTLHRLRTWADPYPERSLTIGLGIDLIAILGCDTCTKNVHDITLLSQKSLAKGVPRWYNNYCSGSIIAG